MQLKFFDFLNLYCSLLGFSAINCQILCFCQISSFEMMMQAQMHRLPSFMVVAPAQGRAVYRRACLQPGTQKASKKQTQPLSTSQRSSLQSVRKSFSLSALAFLGDAVWTVSASSMR